MGIMYGFLGWNREPTFETWFDSTKCFEVWFPNIEDIPLGLWNMIHASNCTFRIIYISNPTAQPYMSTTQTTGVRIIIGDKEHSKATIAHDQGRSWWPWRSRRSYIARASWWFVLQMESSQVTYCGGIFPWNTMEPTTTHMDNGMPRGIQNKN